jgi:hypothetical protein
MRNYYQYWSNKFIKQGLKSIKLVVGLGLSVLFGMDNLVLGILFLIWVLVESLIEKE